MLTMYDVIAKKLERFSKIIADYEQKKSTWVAVFFQPSTDRCEFIEELKIKISCAKNSLELKRNGQFADDPVQIVDEIKNFLQTTSTNIKSTERLRVSNLRSAIDTALADTKYIASLDHS